MVDDDTEELVSLAKSGNSDARDRLLLRYRSRLRRMIRSYLDPRVSPRIDASDILQNALVQATIRLNEYFDKPAISFYSWLRQITRDELIQVHRQHVQAECRAVHRETRLYTGIDDRSASLLANLLVSNETSPSEKASLNELNQRVKQAMGELSSSDREIVMMRCSERLKMGEIAQIMSMSESATKTRFRRAIQKLGRIVGDKS